MKTGTGGRSRRGRRLRRARWMALGVVMATGWAGDLHGAETGGRTGTRSALEAPGAPWPPAAAELTDADVRAGMDAIVAELLARFDPRHGWDPARWTASWGSTSQGGGYTAIVAHALVRAGVPAATAEVRGALALLRALEPEGVYAVAARACLASGLPDGALPLTGDLERLLRTMDVERASWPYRLGDGRGRRDNSIRQFGALAFWEAERRGIAIPTAAWTALDTAFIDAQRPDGGWNYTEDGAPSRGSMTAAAVATLLITEERLAGATGERSAPRGRRGPRRPRSGTDRSETSTPEAGRPADPAARRAAIERGLAWLDRRFDAESNPGSKSWRSYWAYSVERVGMAAGLVRLGGQDWFRTMARDGLARTCRREGARIRVRSSPRPRTVDLAFTLLLLSRGRVPIAVGTLELPGSRTDANPRDAARLAEALGRVLESDVGWRRVGAAEPVDAWLATPVLLASGRDPIEPGPDRDRFRRTLATFLDLGGTLWIVDTGRGRLHRDVTEMMTSIRPRSTRERLPSDHAAWTFHRPVKRRVAAERIVDGHRDLVLLLPGAAWLAPPPTRGGAPAPTTTVLANLTLAASADDPLRPRLAVPAHDAVTAGKLERETGAAAESSPARVATVGLLSLDADRPAPGAERAALEAFGRWVTAAGLPAAAPPDADASPDLILAFLDAPADGAEDGIETVAWTDAVDDAIRRGEQVLVSPVGGPPAGAAADPVQSLIEALTARGYRPDPHVTATLIDRAPRPIDRVRWSAALRAERGLRPAPLRLIALRAPAADSRAAAGPGPDGGPGVVLISREDLRHGLAGRIPWPVAGLDARSARRLVIAAARWAGADRASR